MVWELSLIAIGALLSIPINIATFYLIPVFDKYLSSGKSIVVSRRKKKEFIYYKRTFLFVYHVRDRYIFFIRNYMVVGTIFVMTVGFFCVGANYFVAHIGETFQVKPFSADSIGYLVALLFSNFLVIACERLRPTLGGSGTSFELLQILRK